MKKASLRLAGLCAGAVTILLSVAPCSKAGGLGDPQPNVFQHRNPGSYSACHYWVPRLYTCRAYHRPARLYDQAEWDGGGSYISGSASSPPPSPAPLPPKKIDSQN
jgi:hypothetical protein